MAAPELSVVMPVYNEEAAISEVVTSWVEELDGLGAEYQIRVYDDGSTDGTGERLEELVAAVASVHVVRQENRGHGPTLLRAYRESLSEWIFQTDSDGELGPEDFAALWSRRHDFDFLVGDRYGRHISASRRGLTAAARLTTRWLFGKAVRDVNVPYRLMRRRALQPLLAAIPPLTFAPNVPLSGMAPASGLRVFEAPVRSRQRVAGETSLRGYRLLKAALRSLFETVGVAWRFRTSSR